MADEWHRGRLLDHLQLVVRDLEASRRFYNAVLDVLGIPIRDMATNHDKCFHIPNELPYDTASKYEIQQEPPMETFYLIVAGGGGTLIVCQFLAGLFGFMSDSDVDHDHDTDSEAYDDSHDHSGTANWFLGMLTFRSIAAAITFFGLGGLTARYYNASDVTSFLIALLSAYAALYLVAMLMQSLHQLKADGSVRMERAVGQTGRVYLTIPPRKTGSGKVTLALQNRTVECQAITAENEITTGTAVTVVALHGPNLVEVAALAG